MKRMFYILLIFAVLGFKCTTAESTPVTDDPVTSANIEEPPSTDSKCGCVKYYIYDEVKKECVINFSNLMKRVMIPYDSQTDERVLARDEMEKSIYEEGEKIFRGILTSVFIFLICASICVLSACVYCCRINYSDRKLKEEVKALAKQMHKKYPKSVLKPKAPGSRDPKSESCNVIVEEAGLFVV